MDVFVWLCVCVCGCVVVCVCVCVTGVLVLDRVNGVAYVDISERADQSLAEKWCEELGYRHLVTFR